MSEDKKRGKGKGSSPNGKGSSRGRDTAQPTFRGDCTHMDNLVHLGGRVCCTQALC